MKLRYSPPLLLTLVLLVVGCVHCPVNAPLPPAAARAGYRFQNVAPQTNSDDLLLMLAFSGGGTRAAELSYSVLEELKKKDVGLPDNQHPLLDDVGLISAVSGGSFTATYYALWGDRIFTDFEPQFLKKDVQTGLLLRALAPWNLVRLPSPSFSRTDVAADYYDHLLFKGATYADIMAQRGRPFLCVNATDIASGARFEFTQDEFDLIQPDLSQFPVSHAVAASSALPPLPDPGDSEKPFSGASGGRAGMDPVHSGRSGVLNSHEIRCGAGALLRGRTSPLHSFGGWRIFRLSRIAGRH